MSVADTTFVVDLMRGDANAQEVLDRSEETGTPVVCPWPVVYELFRGLAMSRRPPRELDRILAVLERLRAAPHDGETWRVAGDIDGGLLREGKGIGPLDCLVAAAAVRAGRPVVTRNAEHFRRVTGLPVVGY